MQYVLFSLFASFLLLHPSVLPPQPTLFSLNGTFIIKYELIFFVDMLTCTYTHI